MITIHAPMCTVVHIENIKRAARRGAWGEAPGPRSHRSSQRGAQGRPQRGLRATRACRTIAAAMGPGAGRAARRGGRGHPQRVP